MVAKVLNIIFFAANLLVAIQNLIPELMALLNGHIELTVLIGIAIGVGIGFTAIAMIHPARLLGCSIHLFALSFFSTIFMAGKCLIFSAFLFWDGILFVGSFLLFFACSLSWGLWFVWQLIGVKRTQSAQRRIISR